MQATLQRVRVLESLVLNDPEYVTEQNAIQREVDRRQELLEFIRLIPRACRKSVLMQFQSNDGLRQVFSCMQSRHWPAVPIPLEVIQVYLDDPKASPYQRCIQCHLLLPIRWGIWRNSITKLWWQAPIRYFTLCPACGGTIGSRHEGKPYIYPYVPVRVEPPWEFYEDSMTIASELNALRD